MCICPPGFKGKLCEIGCGSNTYGADCTSHCSFYKSGCKGMYLCTSSFGCTCPAGLTGPLCNQNCPSHKYGNDCTQNCSSKCFNQTCNRYTGACSKGCPSPYIPPDCIEKYMYLLNAPELVSANVNDITIKINFKLNNFNSDKGLKNLKHYYQILYKTPEDTTYTHTKSRLLHLNEVKEVTIKHLKPDTTYTIGILLIRNDGNYNDQNIAFVNSKTTCKIPEPKTNDYTIKVTQESNTTKITWDEIPLTPENCKITKYTLTLKSKNVEDNFNENYTIENTNNTSYDIEDLIDNYEYSLIITPWVLSNPLPSSFAYNFTSLYRDQNRDIGIEGIQASTIENNNKLITNYTIHVSWIFVNYDQVNSTIIEPPIIVKYKINRIFSCSLDEIKNANWTSKEVRGKTSYEISDVTPNAQYMIQVVLHSEDKNEDIIQRKNTVYALIPATKPSLRPLLVEPLQTVNNSVTVKWNIDPKNCAKLNGEFLGFFVILYSNNNNQTFEYITKEYYYDSTYNLNSDTDYEIKVYALNDIGYNTEYFLLNNFTTKIIKPVPIIDDLLIYKKSVKNKMLGLRWKYSNVSNIENIEKFNIFVYGTNTTNVIKENNIEPEKCSNWPEFYCYTIKDLDLKNINEVKVNASDNLNVSETSTVIYKPGDKLPSPPLNLKCINITSTTVTLQWDIPWVFNGLLKSFFITVQDTSESEIPEIKEYVVEETSNYTYLIDDLKPGSTYSIDVVAATPYHSSPASIEITTKST
uniref:Angiopoietin-1 receptor n=2 Tax=Sipha flava TaxID=143950 RepID=A0A2S2QAU1_9HEMI